MFLLFVAGGDGVGMKYACGSRYYINTTHMVCKTIKINNTVS
jgi:hypothetical protein